MPDPIGWVVLFAGALVGSVVGRVAGFGAGIIVLPLVSWAVGIRSAVPALTVTMSIANLSRIWWEPRRGRSRRRLPHRLGADPSGAGHRSVPHAPPSLSPPRRVHRPPLRAGGRDGSAEHALLPGVRPAPQCVGRDRGGVRHGDAPGARGGPRALRALDLGHGGGGHGPRRDDVRGRVAGAPHARPHERSRLPGHHRGAARRDGLAGAPLSAVKPCSVDVQPGATAEVAYTVGADRTAHAMGNRGVHVFATPFVIGMLEDAAGAVLKPYLPPGAGSVGTMVEMKHLAATPVGMTVRAKATLLEIDGKRHLFAVEAWDEKDKIAEGRHERAVVPDMEKFLARAMKKGG